MVYYETDYVTVEHNSILKSAEIKWKGIPFSPDQYRKTIRKAQQLIEEKDIDNLLSDLRKEKQINQDDRNWIRRVVLPDFERLGLKRFAFIYTDCLFNEMNAKGLVDPILTMNFEVKHFVGVEKAHDWFLFYTTV